MMRNNTQNVPGVEKAQDASRAAPAPVIFVAVLLVGVLLNLAFPVSFFPRVITLLVGAACFLLSFILGLAALRAMRRARTSVNPNRPTTALLTRGHSA
jgi:protein-S-isoprenylcysteine O-methyltransferase Ste14